MKTQKFTSKSTSINSNKVPSVFTTLTSKAEKLGINLENSIICDSGCGSFPGIISDHLQRFGAEYVGRDPYNQTESVNAAFIPTANKAITDGKTRIFSSSNVLNVIPGENFRADYIKSIIDVMRPGEKLYITVYEGDGSGNSRATGVDSWQENRKTKSYVPEIMPFFTEVTSKYGMIIATK